MLSTAEGVPATGAGTPLVELRSISKTYPGVRALDDVDFDIRAGEVHALLGENGAGKSSLIKILAGVEQPDEGGSYLIEGTPANVTSPRAAVQHGVAVVFQELNQVEMLSVAENVMFGRLPNRRGLLDRRKLHDQARDWLAKVGLSVDPSTKIGYLSIAERQLVEIARALSQEATVIAMDEPTSALSRTEIETLFGLITQLRDHGVGVLYVSHKLDELFSISDRITVLRDGRKVTELVTAQTDESELVRAMVGRDVEKLFPRMPHEADDAGSGTPALRVTELTNVSLRGVSFEVHPGEVVGFSGLMGAGRTELARAVFGLDKTDGGQVEVGGRRLRRDPAASVRAGVGYVPEDRKAGGLVLPQSVEANMTLATLTSRSRIGLVDRKAQAEATEQMIERLGVKTSSRGQAVGGLSGGNQQKVTLGRWLMHPHLKVLILDEPTRGIDVNSKAEIYRLVADLAQRDIAVVVMSSEMPELLQLCDRIYVMRAGELVAEFNHTDATQENLMSAALGGTQ